MASSLTNSEQKQKVIIDGVPLYISDLITSGDDKKKNITLSSANLNEALMPIAKVGKSFVNMAESFSMSEIEMTLQLSIEIESGVPIFNLLTAKSGAQLEVKMLWKKDEKTQTN